MVTFASIQPEQTIGQLTMFDRILFKGHLTGLYPKDAFARFLSSQKVLLKDFDAYAKGVTGQLKAHARAVAEEAGRPYIYLESARTSKEDLAREIAERDGVTAGLICVLAAVEPCSTFSVRGNRETQHKEVVYQQRKCLHFYFYYLDPEFGFMHVRLQSWFPFQIQLYINGREWLARQLDEQGIGYERYDNCFLRIDDLEAAEKLCDRFAHRQWARVLTAVAGRLNPMLATTEEAGFKGYYWVIEQCEIATDVMFKDQATLACLMPDLFQEAVLVFSAKDVMRFLGRKLHGNFQGEVLTDFKQRPEGRRVKHWMKTNAIKMYDKFSVLRVETTINNSREFKLPETSGDARRWKRLNKGVANFWHFYQVGSQANQRYLDALANVQLKGEALQALDDLCRSRVQAGKRIAKFNPLTPPDRALFAAVMAGEHLIQGFRNRDIQAHLYDSPPATPEEANRCCARVSRLIAKLRGHGLVTRVANSRLYRVTDHGFRLMSAVLCFRQKDFPQAFQTA